MKATEVIRRYNDAWNGRDADTFVADHCLVRGIHTSPGADGSELRGRTITLQVDGDKTHPDQCQGVQWEISLFRGKTTQLCGLLF